MTTARDLLLELGVEELPARFLVGGLASFDGLLTRLEEAGFSFDAKAVRRFATPRRLAILVPGLSAATRDRVQESLGPALAQAKDKDGHWTPAAQGFARSQGTTPERLEVRETDKGPRLCAVRRDKGRPAEKVLPELLPAFIAGIAFPKTMVWEQSRFAFARPLRWILALYGPRVVSFQIAGVKSGKTTRGLRFHGKAIAVPAPDKYEKLLRDRGLVLADPQARREAVKHQIEAAVRPAGGRVPLDEYADLLEEVCGLVEHPAGVLGRFDPRHARLPAEVLITSMKKHQKFFPVFDDAGRLQPAFVGVRNGRSENQKAVQEGYERVLAARLSDAAFFFEKDRKVPLADRVESLKGIAFLAPLTLFDKIGRVRALVKSFGVRVRLESGALAAADRIALLSKADLVTDMVGEFPELQGVMGRLYAEGEPAGVAEGVEQHHWPLTADGRLPVSAAAALVAAADKLDSLAGHFLAGHAPTGSQDPYGLRRAAAGILRVLSERGWSIDLPALCREAFSAFPHAAEEPRAAAGLALRRFLSQRWSALMEAKGFRFDEVQALSQWSEQDPSDAEKRLEALHAFRAHPEFDALTAAFKRANNILSQARKKGVAVAEEGGLGVEEAEKGLFARLGRVRQESSSLLMEKRYGDFLKNLAGLKAPLDDFFASVMVMAEDPALRSARLALLANVTGLFLDLADFSLLQEIPAGAPARR